MATDFVAVIEERTEHSLEPELKRFRRREYRSRQPVKSVIFAAFPILGLVSIGIVHGVNMSGWPNFGNDDEGTYMARAWAVQTGLGAHHGPAPYTYWYDHPPAGWIQLSLWSWLTHTFRSDTVAVASGRGDMLVYTLVTAALVYVVARRLGCPIGISTGAMLLFGLSPLSVQSLRIVMLDTIGLPWILGAFALALTPRKRLWAFVVSGLCFAVGVLCKETYLLLLPALVWLVVQRSKGPTRRMCVAAFASVMTSVLLFYPLYALLKGELLPGPGHVSLLGAIEWQLHGRTGSGSIFHTATDANIKLRGWLDTDPWLLGLGLIGLPAMLVRRFRPIGAAFATFALFLLRTGYLPAEYVTGSLPFAALTAAAAADLMWKRASLQPDLVGGVASQHRRRFRLNRHPARSRLLRRSLVICLLAGIVAMLAPRWVGTDHMAMTIDTTSSLHEAEVWIATHVPHTSTLLVDDDVWIDLVDDGFPPNNVVWLWELDQDPAVRARFPRLWQQMDYVVATGTLRAEVESSARQGIPSVFQALRHSVEVAQFGSGTTWISIYKVDPRHITSPPWWLFGYGSGAPPTHGPDSGQRL